MNGQRLQFQFLIRAPFVRVDGRSVLIDVIGVPGLAHVENRMEAKVSTLCLKTLKPGGLPGTPGSFFLGEDSLQETLVLVIFRECRTSEWGECHSSLLRVCSPVPISFCLMTLSCSTLQSVSILNYG